MEIGLIVIILVFVIGGYFSLKKTAKIGHALARSIQQQSIAPILTQIHTLPTASRPDQFHRAISHLWKGYERPLAANLIHSFVSEHKDVAVAHFWVQEMLSVEPALGQQTLSQEFLEQEFKPELAACCGPAG